MKNYARNLVLTKAVIHLLKILEENDATFKPVLYYFFVLSGFKDIRTELTDVLWAKEMPFKQVHHENQLKRMLTEMLQP